MAKDFRKLEKVLESFFQSRGIPGSHMRGNLYLGVCSTESNFQRGMDGQSDSVALIVPNEHACGIVSLTELASELAEEFA